MKPNQFDYVRATSVDEAVRSLEGCPDARVIAGGLSLVPMLNFRLTKPGTLVDISDLDELRYVKTVGGKIEVGAAVTQNELRRWPELSDKVPLLAKALHHVGHYQTRNRGTVCGSISHSDPSAELPLTIATLRGEIVLQSKRRKRVVTADDFQIGMLSTDCQAGELVTAVRFPVHTGTAGFAFDEFARRKGDFAIVAIATVTTGSSIRIGIGGVADTPAVREWEALDGDALEAALNDLAWELGGYSDIHATAEYRRELVRRLGKKTIERARRCQS